jgi:hypothetical protein
MADRHYTAAKHSTNLATLKLYMSVAMVIYLGVGVALSAAGTHPFWSSEWQGLAIRLLISGIALCIAFTIIKQVAFLIAGARMDLHSDVNWTVFVVASFYFLPYLVPFLPSFMRF